MLVEDKFIREILNKPSWVLTKLDDIKSDLISDKSDKFIYTKTDCLDISAIKTIEANGFNLIDTNIQFERSNNEFLLKNVMPADYSLKFGDKEDALGVRRVAETSFKYTRFHLDPLISNENANRIKGNWASNFFSGKRGDYMVVLSYQNNPVGFLQLISKQQTQVIDLIAISKDHQGKGLASHMINFVATECGVFSRMLVGTQISNLNSMRLYEKLGFRICGSSYIFHYHD